jgi:predicted esterase
MSLFRVDPDNVFQGPHQGIPSLKAGKRPEEAAAAVLLVHGRGASAQSMLQFAEELKRDDLHYRALQADGYTWYPYSFLADRERNQPGISSGLQAIHDEIEALNAEGMATERIFILGFSQGACLVTEFAVRHPRHFGGIIGLSGGLIGPEIDPSEYFGDFEGTPVFLGCSDNDPHIPVERVHETATVFERLGARVAKKIYPKMGHTVNEDEIAQIWQMLDGV